MKFPHWFEMSLKRTTRTDFGPERTIGTNSEPWLSVGLLSA